MSTGPSIQAFGWALFVWAVLSAVRAPLMVIREDRQNGSWRGHRFCYKNPRQVFTREFMGNGLTNVELITFEDAEPNSYVEFHIDLQPPVWSRVNAALSSGPSDVASPTEIKFTQRGHRINGHRQAYLLVKSLQGTTPVLCRVYCDSFTIGPA